MGGILQAAKMLELNTEIPSKYLAANAGPDKSKSKPRASTIDNE